MAANDSFFQQKKPAAVLKHAVFSSYVSAFSTMVSKGYAGRPLWLIDGYAGPGRYDADDDGDQVSGSPIVALELAEKAKGFSAPRDIRCAFIESEAKYASALRMNVRPFQDRGLYADVYQGEVKANLVSAWQKVGDDPVITLLDPFGVSTVPRSLMSSVLLQQRGTPSEVLLNINVMAVSRHGGYLKWGAGGAAEIAPGLKPQGVEMADEFFGGTWWRASFLEARARLGSASLAALAVVDEYRVIVEQETGNSSIAVPIKRRESEPMLFLFTLFYRHAAAGYKFADAAAKGTRRWREAFRRKDLEDMLGAESAQGMFPGFDEMFREGSEQQGKERDAQLLAESLATIEGNVRALIAPMATGHGFQIAPNINAILGEAMSLAGEPEIRKVWDQLAVGGVVKARDKSQKSMWKQYMLKP